MLVNEIDKSFLFYQTFLVPSPSGAEYFFGRGPPGRGGGGGGGGGARGGPQLFDCPISVHPSGFFQQLVDYPPHRRSLRLEVKRKGRLKPSFLRAQDLLCRKHKFVRIALKAARSSSSSSSRLHLPG